VQICAVITKNVSGTKMCYFVNCERSEEMRGCELGGVYQRRICYTPHIVGVVVSYNGVVIGVRGVEPRLKMSVQSHWMR
jgi:hypothetical protein